LEQKAQKKTQGEEYGDPSRRRAVKAMKGTFSEGEGTERKLSVQCRETDGQRKKRQAIYGEFAAR